MQTFKQQILATPAAFCAFEGHCISDASLEKDVSMNYPKILRRKDVEVVTGLSRSSIYAMMKADAFPSAIRLGQRAVGWRDSDIAQWLNERAFTRTAAVETRP
jgi:prophage regulatory protein